MMQEMWNAPPGFFRPSKSAPCSPAKPIGLPRTRSGSFHITHKIPVGDTPYVRAKHVQLVDKDPEKAIPLFWAAINAGDRVDSALKDMAIVMKQQNRPEEAIEAIKSLRHRCSEQAQESLENILLDLYKRCGRLDDQVALLRHKLYLIQKGLAFNGKRTKTARSQGKKFQVSVEQEATRLLGNLGWALMQQNKYIEAEDAYRRALSIAPDNNKMCNLGICLMKQGRISEAKDTLRLVKPAVSDGPRGVDSHLKAYERAQQMLQDLESETMKKRGDCSAAEQSKLFESFLGSSSLWQPQPCKDHSVPLPTTSTVPATRNNTKPVLPSSCVGDEFPDENFINSIVAPTQAKQLASSYIGGGQKDIYGKSLNIYAPPFCPSETLTKEPVDLNQFQETHKRTRSGNAATNPVGENIPSHQSLRIQQHPSEDTAAALGTNNNLLPDDKSFENAIISAVLNANSEDAGGRGSISSIMSVPSANPLRGGGTTTTTTATGGLQRKISSIGKRLKVFQDITLSLSPSPSPKA